MYARSTSISKAASSGFIAAVLLTALPTHAQQADGSSHEHHHERQALPASDVLADIDIDFELLDGYGSIVTDEDFLGRYWLLGFGFTRCTDVCPIMVANMARIIDAIGPELTAAFVSVDTERDSPEVVSAYASGFLPTIVGLGGSVEQINEAARNFKVSYVVTKTQNSYVVQHTSHVFLIDAAGELVDVFDIDVGPDEIAAAMKHE